MDLELSDEQRIIVQSVRRFIREEIRPLEADLDPDAFALQADDTARLTAMTREMGLYQMGVPVEYGGPGLDVVTQALVAEELSQHRAGVYSPAYGVFGSNPPLHLYSGTERQQEEYLYPTLRGEKRSFVGMSEASGGSDLGGAIQTRAVRDGDEWVINGSKLWNTSPDTADYGVIYVRTGPGEGRRGLSLFIVDTDTPGFRMDRFVHVLRSHAVTELSFIDVRVPHENLLGEVGGAFTLDSPVRGQTRVLSAANGVGVAVAANEMAVEWAKQRVTFGEPLANRQAIQWMLVDNQIDIRNGRWAVLAAADRADRGQSFGFESAMAKLLCSEGAGRVVDRSMQILGGLGMSKDLSLERWYREVRIRRIGDGPNEVHRTTMARAILGDGPGG
ncbi:MAG TPA: acyl-CoA dehydrogenase family protein [Acidobacteriota bacterium]|nr:acyl-CoA dehydrogenase family protein [Acidobacteriota bacterium]